MNKILSIIIPTYNMEKYLSRCLDSLVCVRSLDDIEIVVVNDGSKDNSLEIANQYKTKYPQSLVVIDKKNGNYGSTINAALPIITGKYVKVLDSDDWFDSDSLEILISKLKITDVDMILTGYSRCYVDGKIEVVNYSSIDEDKIYDLSTFTIGEHKNNSINMHRIAYRSSILKDNNYTQTEGISYTDNEWVYYPMQYIYSLMFIDLNIYKHFIGRDEQTTNKQVHERNFYQEIIILEKMLERWKNCSTENKSAHDFMLKFILGKIKISYEKKWIFSLENINITNIENILSRNPELYKATEDLTYGKLPKFKFIKYWRKNGNYPAWLLCYINTKRIISKKIRSLIG